MSQVEIVKFGAAAPIRHQTEDVNQPTRLQITIKATSVVDRDLFVRVRIETTKPTQGLWFSIPSELSRSRLAARGELTIPLTIDLPAGTPFDKYPFSVLVANDDAPETEYSSVPLVVERGPKPIKLPWKWWPLVAGGAVAAAVAVVVVVLVVLPPDVGDKCNPADARCPTNTVCPPDLNRCVLQASAACEKPEHCLSGKCTGGVCAALALGEACLPSHSACGGELQCPPRTKRCSAQTSAPCRTAADCVRGACTNQGGGRVCGLSIGQSNCQDTAKDCPEDQECAKDGTVSYCLLKPGQLCPNLGAGTGDRTGPDLCSAQYCNDRARCAPTDNTCPAPGDCRQPNQCRCPPDKPNCAVAEKRCFAPSGAVPAKEPLRKPVKEAAEKWNGKIIEKFIRANPGVLLQ